LKPVLRRCLVSQAYRTEGEDEMKARVAKVVAPRTLEIVEEDIPQPGAGQVLVKVKACGLCHSDLPVYDGSKGPVRHKMVEGYEVRFRENTPEFPCPIGHEAAGIVEAVGPGVSRFKVGDRVVGFMRGCFATHVVTSVERIFCIPGDMPLDETAPLAEPLMCVTNIVRAANPEIGDYVAVIGAGFMGLLVDAGLSKYPIRELIAVDLIDERLDLAARMGATLTLNPKREDVQQRIIEITRGRGVDIAVDITGRYAGLELAANIIKSCRGKILAASNYVRAETLDIGTPLLLKAPIIHAVQPAYSTDYARDIATGIWAARKKIFPAADLITHKFAFEDVDKAFQTLAANPKEYLKGIVVIDSEVS